MKLVLVGGCRNEEDWKRVEELKRMVESLDMADHVVFDVNVRGRKRCDDVGAVRATAALPGDESRGSAHHVERALRHLRGGVHGGRCAAM